MVLVGWLCIFLYSENCLAQLWLRAKGDTSPKQEHFLLRQLHLINAPHQVYVNNAWINPILVILIVFERIMVTC